MMKIINNVSEITRRKDNKLLAWIYAGNNCLDLLLIFLMVM